MSQGTLTPDLYRQHKKLLHCLVRRFTSRDRSLDSYEVFQEACVGLLLAMNAYDPKRINPETGQPYSLWTLAGLTIHRRLRRYADRHRQHGMTQVGDAARPGVKVYPMGLLSDLDSPTGTDSPTTCGVLDKLGIEDYDPETDEVAANLWKTAKEILTHQEYWVLWSSYAQNQTDVRISRWMGVSKARIGQIRKKAIEKMRSYLSEQGGES